MINWLKTWWKQQERKSDKEFDEYLESCTLKDVKPCPFCGGEKVIIMQQGYYLKEYHVMCLNCGARNSIKFNKEIAIINWNLRVEIPVNSKPLKTDFTDDDLPDFNKGDF